MRILARALTIGAAIGLATLLHAQSFDLVIANGRVIDPESGLDGIRHIGISGRTIAAISADPLVGRATINAAGLVVAPGFIDLHAHGQTPETYGYQARDGVTTAFELEVGTADIERWYADRKPGKLINYGVSIGHIPVRMAVLRDPGKFLPTGDGAHRAATPEQIKEIVRRLEEGLKQGAVSMGAGFAYTPAASQEELLEVFRVAGRNRVPVHVHIRRGAAGLEEVLKLAGQTKAPLHVVHINSSGAAATAEMLKKITDARAQGLDVTTEAYPYAAGMTEIQSANLDDYQDAPEQRVALLEWPRTGERLNRETFQKYRKIGGPVVLHTNTEEMVSLAITSPLTMIASDSYWENGTGHPRTTGTYSKVLGRYVRDSKSLSLTDAIRKMTLMPAQRLQERVPAMRTKGRLRVGGDADVTVFDAAQVIDKSTYREPGLPPVGIRHVIVNGVPVVAMGQVVEGVAPGQAVRANPPAAAAAGSCEGLLSLKLPSAAITLAQIDKASQSCRVAATLRPTSDSEIKMEIWMPVSNWNGKYQAVGNGAFNGNINVGAISSALESGYAASSTDTGHTGGGASWGLGHPEKVIDFGWRAVHETAVASKRIIAGYYGSDPKFSYWNGCSAGGRQAMKAAQRFPADFNGIIAGAPGLDWTGRAAQAVRIAKRLEQNEAARLGQAERQLLHSAVVASCDLIDGVKDGVIENPKQCKFDPGVLQCKSADGTSCLTPPQVETARMIYSAAVNPKTKRAIHGLEPGSELGWTDLGWTESARATGLDQFRFLVFGDPGWNIQKFNFDSDIVLAEERNDAINALDPNLKPFISSGGKLIQYHGWSDPQIAPAGTTQYYARVLEASGGRDTVDGSYRLFMAPGMGHCRGGEGPNTFDMVPALERWVEAGVAPDQITASITRPAEKLHRSRPLCPYPQVAVYKGAGSTDDAANFACRLQ